MLRFHWNHHQALLQKYIDPLHKIAKMRLKKIYVLARQI